MEFLDDPEEMTPEQRLSEVACILAAGYIRLRRSRDSAPSAENPLDCSGAPMALCDNGLERADPEEHAA
jgi:hypothetical protein